MRPFIGTLIVLAASVYIPGQASALSLMQSGRPQTQQEASATHAKKPDAYLVKPNLNALTEAMRLNREHRRMFADLTKGSGRSENALMKYIKALDVRYSIMAAVGDSLVKATTQTEVTEASALAEAVLAVRTDLDGAVGETQMAVIEAARRSKGYFGACDSHGELADGTKCVRVLSADGGQQFWAQPWNAGKFAPASPQGSISSP